MPPLDLFHYQEVGADWLARRERGALLDQPGAGKSAQVVRALDLRRAVRGVIVVPAHLRENWILEFAKFAHLKRNICKAKDIHDFVAWSRGVFDVLILSYELATRWTPMFFEHGEFVDFIIFDEAHYLKNLEAARTKALLGPDANGVGGLAQWSIQAWMLTGTLMPNDPVDMYPVLRFCRATDLSPTKFTHRYFHSQQGTWNVRNTPRLDRVPELRELIARNSIRRTLADVGYELPPIHMTGILVDGDTEAVRAMLLQHPGLEQATIQAVQRGGLSFLDAQHIATLRRLIAEAKAVPYVRMIIDELNAVPDRKLVVMGVSRTALQHIQDALTKAHIWAVMVQGGVSETMRVEAVKSFQTAPSCRVFIANIMAGGTGLTLTAAAHLDLFESTWSSGPNEQAIMRIRRISQTRTQFVRFITLARSIDEVVNAVVEKKTTAIARIEGTPMLAVPSLDTAYRHEKIPS